MAGVINAGVPFDLLLLDLTLPGGMGGQAVLKEILLIDPDAKAIVSSGFIHEHVTSSPAFKGFKGVLSKPYTEIQLLEVLEQVLT